MKLTADAIYRNITFWMESDESEMVWALLTDDRMEQNQKFEAIICSNSITIKKCKTKKGDVVQDES